MRIVFVSQAEENGCMKQFKEKSDPNLKKCGVNDGSAPR